MMNGNEIKIKEDKRRKETLEYETQVKNDGGMWELRLQEEKRRKNGIGRRKEEYVG